MSFLKLQNISKKFANKLILDRLNLELEKGETFVILGPSGCGKSVTIRILAGLMKADSGSVIIEGHDLWEINQEKRQETLKMVGMLFQSAALFDSMNIYDNIAFGFRASQLLDEKQIALEVAKNLDLVGLAGIEKLMPSELSGGMRKRAGLARAIALRPKLMLYDEPTTGLDPIRSTEIDQLIIKLQKELNTTSIVITHDLKSAFRVADRIGLHFNGQIQTIANKEEFFNLEDLAVKQFINGELTGPLKI